MTPAEAHVWIAVFAATYQANSESMYSIGYDIAARTADSAVRALRKSPPRMKELEDALRQGSDIP